MKPVINPSAVASLQNMNTVGHLTVKGLLAVDKIREELRMFFREVWEEYKSYSRLHADSDYTNGFLMKGHLPPYYYDRYEMENKGTSVRISGYWSYQGGGETAYVTLPIDALATGETRRLWFAAHFTSLRAEEDTAKARRVEAARQADLKALAALQAKYPEASNCVKHPT